MNFVKAHDVDFSAHISQRKDDRIHLQIGIVRTIATVATNGGKTTKKGSNATKQQKLKQNIIICNGTAKLQQNKFHRKSFNSKLFAG